MSTMTINGRLAPLPDDPDALLIDVVRDDLDLTGTKLVCGAGVCGACTVLVDGAPVVSCLMPARAAADKSVTTVEGIGADTLHPVQKAFMAHDALQCGFCTPGFIVEAAAFHDHWRATKGTATPSREEIGAALSGHLCRCGAYDGIFSAVAAACAGHFDGGDFVSPRVEARDKVTGAAKYTVDIRHDGQLEGVILRSQIAHARITELDLAPALAMPGVSAAISLLGDDRMVRFVGEPIAAVAAKDRKTALAAIAAIKMTSERAAVGDRARCRAQARCARGVRKSQPQESRQRLGRRAGAGAWKGNVRGPSAAFSQKAKKARSWVAAARDAEKSAAGRRHLPHRHAIAYLPRAACHGRALRRRPPHRACFDAGGVPPDGADRQALQARPRQGPRHRRSCRRRLWLQGQRSAWRRWPRSISRAQRKRRSGSPIDRHEELSVTGYRPAAEMKIALLPSEQGDLKALSLTAYADTGAATNSTLAGLARLIYPAEAKELADFDVISNLPPGAPFRGPGGPPMAFALEQAIDEAALRMKVDPIALRKRWDPNPNRQRLYDWAPGSTSGATGKRRPRRPAAIAAASASRPATGSISGSPASKVELAVKGGRLDRQHRDPGYRHRQPHRDRQYGGARIRSGAA